MMIKRTIFYLYVLFLCFGNIALSADTENLVIETKRIYLEAYPDAFNPSIIKTDYGYLLTFRYCPDRTLDSYSFVGVVRLDESFEQISPPQLLDTRYGDTIIPPHSEDGRILYVEGRMYVIYNDNQELILCTNKNRRDIFVAELIDNGDNFTLVSPVKLKHLQKYEDQLWQKNWVPFDWQGILLMGYSIRPHEVLFADLINGDCHALGISKVKYDWKYGILRGGTPALMVGNEYLAFFHSSLRKKSDVSNGKKLLHYFMGAYTFSPKPPFAIQKISTEPIIADGFYTKSDALKRIIFPGGFVVNGDLIYVVYGKDDREIWIATIDKNKLMSSMKAVRSSF